VFYLLPASAACFNQANLIEKSKNAKSWTKKEKTGLALDITLVASICILAALILSAHLGLSMGPLNAISSIPAPVMIILWPAATLLFAADLFKIACRSSASNQKTLESPSLKKFESVKKSEAEIEQLPSDSPQEKRVDSAEAEQLPPDSSQNKLVQAPEVKPSFPERVMKAPLIDFSECEMDSDFEHVSDGILPPEPTHEQPVNILDSVWGELKQLGQRVVSGTNTVAKTTAQWIADWFKPGNIQMRFYNVHINFLVEQLLCYNENEKCFTSEPIPLAFSGKCAKLQTKKFANRDITTFKETIVRIIEENKEHPYTTRYYILAEIENAYAKLNEKSPDFHLFLQQLAYQLYTQFDGFTYGEQLIENFFEHKETLEFKELANIIVQDQKKITTLSKEIAGSGLRDLRDRSRGAAGVAFYPMLTNNFACQLWKESYTNGHTVEILRFGSPTAQYAGSATLLGQMKLFVQECERKNQTLLSFQHQSFDGEAARLNPMLEIAEVHPNAFYFFNLDMDSAFFHQSRKGIDINDKQEDIEIECGTFKMSLIDHMEGMVMSSNLKARLKAIPTYRQDLEHIAQEVLEGYLPGHAETLTRKEREDFILSFYGRFRHYLHFQLAPSFSCSICKDTMDRSISLLAVAFMEMLMDLGQHKDPTALKSYRTFMNFIGLIIKGSPMHHKRFERYLPVLNRLTSLESPPKIRSWLVKQEMHRTTFDHLYTQLPCNIMNKKEYLQTQLAKKTSKGEKRFIMPLYQTTDAPKIIEHLYRNNGIDIGVSFLKDQQFLVYQGNKDMLLGKYSVDHNNLYVEVNWK